MTYSVRFSTNLMAAVCSNFVMGNKVPRELVEDFKKLRGMGMPAVDVEDLLDRGFAKATVTKGLLVCEEIPEIRFYGENWRNSVMS